MVLPSSAPEIARAGKMHLFVTTWNMGGVAEGMGTVVIPHLLPKWIPLGYDLYVSV